MRKTYLLFGCAFFASLMVSSTFAQDISGQDSTGLPGDNFSLHGALEMFKKAGSPEEFEKLINSTDNHVNNLDLNGDGNVDYIRVIEKMEKGDHVFVLQDPVSEKENQDIAVIELEKNGDESAMLQIIGDEDIYGEKVIVEPNGGGENDDNGNRGNGPAYSQIKNENNAAIIVNVWLWPCVRFVYRPAYVVWVSPWYWHTYPLWWHPWRPYPWHVYHPWVARYHGPYVICHTHRVIRAHAIYSPVRASSVVVRTRYATPVNHYRVTRTTVIRRGPAGVRERRTILKRGRH